MTLRGGWETNHSSTGADTMRKRTTDGRHGAGTSRQAVVAVAMVVVLLIIDLAIVGIVIGLSRDHDLTVRRLRTVEAAYAAEAGVNMSIREMMNVLDEDGDTKIGGISDNDNAADDPAIGNARFFVDYDDSNYPPEWKLTSEGRSGDARRRMETVLNDPS